MHDKCVIFFHKNIHRLYRQEWIDKCILSILNQSMQDFDIFEINYGEEPNSLFNKYHLGAKKLYYYSVPLFDHTFAMNFIIDKAFSMGYDTVFNTNLDDFYHPLRFEKQLLSISQGYDLVSSLWYYVNEEDKITLSFTNQMLHLTIRDGMATQESIKRELAKNNNVVNHSGVCFTRKFWETYDHNGNLLRYDDKKPYEDLLLWQRAILSDKIKIGIIDDKLIYYRVHNSQICSDNREGKKFPSYPGIAKKRAGILLVATGKYKAFLQRTMTQIREYFLPQYEKKFFLFVDSDEGIQGDDVITTIIKRRGFPGDTLYRYHYFLLRKEDIIQLTDVVYYFDVDMGIWQDVGDEVLPNEQTPLIGVRHPGFYMPSPFPEKWGSPETNPVSTAYIPLEKRVDNYIAGGFNGGVSSEFMKMSEEIKRCIEIDDENEVVAVWHDESQLNRYFTSCQNLFKVLLPEYCFPEGHQINLTPKIVALNKDHSFYRQSEKYVTCEFMGGLGNILFQLATTIAFGKERGYVPVFSVTHPSRDVDLPHNHGKSTYRNSILRDILRLHTEKMSFERYSECSYVYSPINVNTEGNVRLFGYFQSWKYFHAYRDDILNSVYLQNQRAQDLYSHVTYLLGSKTVSVHVRRGDYCQLPEFHYNLSENYYRKAIALFPSDTTFIVFSDDIEWCKKSDVFGKLSSVFFIEGLKDYEELAMMTMCEGNIIANSSFSWWGAYLNQKKGKVVYPLKWFAMRGPQYDIQDIALPEWIGVEDLDPGISFLVRAKNEELNINLCISSLLPVLERYPNAEVIYVDNGSTDGTYGRALEFANKYPQIKVYQYDKQVARCGQEHVNAVQNKMDNTISKYFNWCIEKVTKYNIIKWDADFVANIGNLLRMLDTFKLAERTDAFALWCTGETIFIHQGTWYRKNRSWYDEYRAFSKLNGFRYEDSEAGNMETPAVSYISYLPQLPHIVHPELTELPNSDLPKQIAFLEEKGLHYLINKIEVTGNEKDCYFCIRNGGITHNWKRSSKHSLPYIPGYRELYEEPVFYEIKRTSIDEFTGKESLIDRRDSEDFTILQGLNNFVYNNISSYKQNKFFIVVPSYNCKTYLSNCLGGIAGQTYKNYRVCLIDDASPDPEHVKMCESFSSHYGWTLIKNKQNKGALYNIINGIKVMKCDDDEIIVTLDGDDWLHEEALQIINLYYQDDTMMTYGRFIYHNPDNKVLRGYCYHNHFGFSEEVPSDVKQEARFRDIHWIFSHLRTFKYKLWKRIRDEDLRDQNGKYLDVTWDMAFMFPMLEMARERVSFINFPLYIYNIENPSNDFKSKQRRQAEMEMYLRGKDRYERLE